MSWQCFHYLKILLSLQLSFHPDNPTGSKSKKIEPVWVPVTYANNSTAHCTSTTLSIDRNGEVNHDEYWNRYSTS